MERTVIPKDCAVCDICNNSCTDDKFIATIDSYWYEGWLYCEDCKKKYPNGNGRKLIRAIKKGEDISDTDLALPIVMEFGD